jgi:quercetin dioxygenase-like cupin family protein
MGRIVIKRREELTALRPSDRGDPARLARLSEGELTSTRREYFPDDGEPLELFEITFGPGSEIQPHAHTSPEIIYVTAGELVFGAQRCGSGSAVFVDADTLYGFRAGDDGVTFINFRGQPRPQYLTKDEFMERHRAEASTGRPGHRE